MEVFLYTLTQLLQNCLICSSCYSSLTGLYQPFAWTSILWIPDVSSNETEKQRKLGLWAEVESSVPKSPTPCTLSTSKCIFGTFQFSFSWKGKKEPNQKLKPSKQTTKWCSVIFLTFETAPDNSMPAPTSFKIQQSKCSSECC